MPSPKQRLGLDAEQAAEQFLAARSHRVLLRNYRCRMGELDLIACDDSRAPALALVIAEVRLRSRRDFGGGAASVDHRKQRRLLRATRHLLATHADLARLPVRFDVLDMAPQPDGSGYRIEWIRHAFSA
jgi:putative endonuclease